MLSKMGRHAGTALCPVALALLLSAGPAPAQQGMCGQQNRSRQSPMQGQSGMRAAFPMQQNALRTQLPQQQQYGLQAQFPPQQDPALVALQQQQNALMAALQQQNAQLAVLQQQNALLVAQQRRQQQNAMLVAQQFQLQQQNAPAAQPRGPQGGGEPAEQPEDPEATAARKLQVARTLIADAGKAQFEGEQDRAAKIRARAAERLQDVVAQYPGSKAADKAQQLLDRLGL
jgi:hypothetical protein